MSGSARDGKAEPVLGEMPDAQARTGTGEKNRFPGSTDHEQDGQPCMVTHIARVWINRVRLPILLVVS